jgi:hypothetical protein
MAKLTKRQKQAIEMLTIYTKESDVELQQNGLTEVFYLRCSLCVSYRDELGLDVPDYLRAMADRHEEIRNKRETA